MRNRWNYVRASLLLALLFGAIPALAESVFTIENPAVDFEVIDAEPFDGIGDNGPYNTFNDVALGTLGEARSMAEFDLSGYGIPSGEFIYRARFDGIITSVRVFGLGIDGETPSSVAVDGYLANGVAELSDFQAGDGNLLDSVATADPYEGQLLSFDVTAWIAHVVELHQPWVGLTARAETFGGFWLGEGGVYPRLQIWTGIPGDLDHDGDVDISDLATLLAQYGTPSGATYEDGDIDHDGDVDLSDLAELLAHYGQS